MRSLPIIVIDDDLDDIELIRSAMHSLNIENPLMSFENPIEAINYLKISDKIPFLIFCDINMPFINGFEFRRMIEADRNLKLKTIPFLFLTTAADKANIEKAYNLSVQGYFKKPVTNADMMKMLKDVIAYWERAYRPYSSVINN